MRHNKEIYDIHKEMNFIDEIKIRRFKWPGNLQRMDEKRLLKKILDEVFYSTRMRGRPRNR